MSETARLHPYPTARVLRCLAAVLLLTAVEQSHAQNDPPADRSNLWSDEIDRRLDDLGVLFTCAAPTCADCDRACRVCEGRWEQAATAAEPLDVLDVSEPVEAPSASGSLWINAGTLAPGESVVLTLRSDQITDDSVLRLRFMDQAVSELLTASRAEPWAAGEAQISMVNAHASEPSPATFGLAFATDAACDECADCNAASCSADGLDSCAAPLTLHEGTPTSVYTVSLLSVPSIEPVVVAASFTSTCDGVSVAPETLVFFLSSWNEPQEMRLVFADDWIHATPECEIVVTHVATSEDGNYAGLEKSVHINAVVDDRDDALIYALPASMVLHEGGGAQSYDVRLASPPGCADCSGYHLRWSGQAEAAVPDCLSVVDSDSSAEVQQRECVEGEAATWEFDDTAVFSNSLAPNQCLGYDQSSGALTLAPCDGSAEQQFLQQSADADLHCSAVSESACFYKVASTVTVITQGFGEQVLVSPASLQFSSSNWREPQRVTVEVADDDYADGRRNLTIQHLVLPRIGNPISTHASVLVVVEDNDLLRARTSVSQLEMGENSSRTYTVQLAAQPREEIAIHLRSASGVRDGSTHHRAARSCMDLLRDFPDLVSGIYWVNPSGAPFEVACDMETEGGGWYALSVESDLLPGGVVVAQRFDRNPWRKCSDDAARHYKSLSSENDAAPVPLDDSEQSVTGPELTPMNVTQKLAYSSAFGGGELEKNQIAAIRNQVTELSMSSRIVVSIADDSGYEVVAVDADGNEKQLNPGSPMSCGDSNGEVGNSQFYLWHNTLALSHGDALATPLAQSFLLPTAVRMTVPSSGGGGASFGWENSVILVRPGRSDLQGCSQAEYPSSCSALKSSGITASGIYTIDVDSQGGEDPFEVYCDMSTADGGWTIIFRTGCMVDAADPQNLCAPQSRPDMWAQSALSAAQQHLLGSVSTESLVRRSDGAWLKTSSAFAVGTHSELAPMVRIQAVNITSGTTLVPGFQSVSRDGAEFGVYSSAFDSFADATEQCEAAYLQKSRASQAFEIGAGVGSWTTPGCTVDQEPLAFYVALRGPSLQAGCGAESCPRIDTTCTDLSSGRHICHSLSLDLAQQSNVRFDPQVLSFSESTWDVPQTVSVTVSDNDVQQAEAHYELNLLHAVVGAAGEVLSDSTPTVVRVNVTEDDTVGLKIVAETTMMQESCLTREAATWVVSLSSAPVRDVSIALELPHGAGAVPAFIFFPAAGTQDFCSDTNVNDVRDRLASFSLIATAIVEHIDSADEYLWRQAIVATCPDLTDASFDTEVSEAILVAAILVNPISSVASAKAFLDALSIHLDVLPAQLQFVQFDEDEQQLQVMVKPCAHALAWDLPQRVRMTAVDDELSLGDRQVAVIHRVVTEDSMYACEDHTFVAIVADDDEAGLRVVAAPSTLQASGYADTVSISLTAQPSADVVVSCQGSENLRITEGSIAFTTTDYATAKSFAIAVQNMANPPCARTREVVLDVRSDDAAFDGITARLTINVTAQDGIRITELQDGPGDGTGSLFVSESGIEATYQISLSSQPCADVVVSMQQEEGHGFEQLRFIPAHLSFTSATWNESQTVRLSAVDDDIDEGMNSSVNVWHTTTSEDPMYAGVLGQLGYMKVIVEDDDTAAIRPSELELIVREGVPAAHGEVSAALACSLLLDDDDKPYVFCGGQCTPESLCDPAARQECVDSCFTTEHWVVVHRISVLGQDACRARCLEYGVDTMEYKGNGTCSCLSLRGDMPNWVKVAKFGPSDINSIETLQANGWTTDNINDFRVCGLSGCTACGQPGASWCCSDSQPCSGRANYVSFWRGGAGSGSISFILPVGYNKGRLHVGMSYNNPACHGLVTVGGETIFDEMSLVDDHYVEFDCKWTPTQPNKKRTN